MRVLNAFPGPSLCLMLYVCDEDFGRTYKLVFVREIIRMRFAAG